MVSKNNKHRQGCGYAPTAPTGLMEHSRHGLQMENVFQFQPLNKLIDMLIFLATDDHALKCYRQLHGGKVAQTCRTLIDLLGSKIDKSLFLDQHGAKLAFLGKINASNYRSALGGMICELLAKYGKDWEFRQVNKIEVPRVKRKVGSMPPTYAGFKQLTRELQPTWQALPEDPKDPIKIFENDIYTPKERIERIIQGKDVDRVGYGPSWNWGVAYMGKTNLWKFCYDGIETGWASLNTWIHTGGSDFLPSASGIAAYSLPWPEGHSRFYYQWNYPADNILPQFIEKELLKTYDNLFDYGMTGLLQDITKRMIRDTFVLAREIIYWQRVLNTYFGPFYPQFLPYASGMFYVWDILPFWRSLLPFSRDVRKRPELVVEAFDLLNKPLTDLMVKICKLTKAKTALFGNSRAANTWMSPLKFQETFWPSMKYAYEQCIKHDIIPVCHFDNDWTENMPFLAEKLPKRSCIFHLDQVDLVKVHDLIGNHFALMGGQSPGLLVFGTPEKVKDETKRYIEQIGQDGLIIASGCEMPCDIPVQNVFAQKRAIKESMKKSF